MRASPLRLPLLLMALAPWSAAEAAPFAVEGRFSVEPPAGWTSVEPGAYLESQRRALKTPPPSATTEAPTPSPPPLAIFLAPAEAGFQSNLNVRRVDGRPRLDEQGVVAYREQATLAFGSLRATIERAELLTIGDQPALRAELGYELGGRRLRSVQALFAGRRHTYIATFTTLEARREVEGPAIEASLRSFRVREPWYELLGGGLFPYAVLALVGGGVLAVLFRRRNAQLG